MSDVLERARILIRAVDGPQEIETHALLDEYLTIDDGIAYARMAIAMEAELVALRKVAEWYVEKAEAMARYASAKPPKTEAMMAVVTELCLDAGRRLAALQPGDLPT